MTELCRWFGVPKWTVCYRPDKAVPTVQESWMLPITRRQIASRIIGEWMDFRGSRSPPRSLSMATPAMAYAAA